MTDYRSHTCTTPSNVQNTAVGPPHPTLTKLGFHYKLLTLNLLLKTRSTSMDYTTGTFNHISVD